MKNIKLIEKIVGGLTVVAVLMGCLTNSFLLEICVFGGILAILYFPLGFVILRTSPPVGSIASAILLGLIYSISTISMIFAVIKTNSYQYPVFIAISIMIITALYLYIRYRSGRYTIEFLKLQFLRIGILVLMNLMVYLKQVIR